MSLIDYLTLSIKNLWRRKIRTFLASSAITVGGISVILIVVLVIGAKSVLVDKIDSLGGLTLISVTPSTDMTESGMFRSQSKKDDNTVTKKLDDATVKQLLALPHVDGGSALIGVDEFFSMNIKGSDKKVTSRVYVAGLDTSDGGINVELIAGRPLKKNELDAVIIDGSMLEFLGVDDPNDVIGKKLVLTAAGNYSGWGADMERIKQYWDKDWEELQKQTTNIEINIVGVSAGSPMEVMQIVTPAFARELLMERRWEYDKDTEQKWWREHPNNKGRVDTSMFINLKTTPSSVDKNGYNVILLNADGTDNIKTVSTAVKALDYGAQTAEEMLDQINRILNGVGTALFAIGAVSLLVAAIGIINTMLMSTYERIQEIGVMRACGATRATIRRLFTLEAALLGLWGGVAGILVCYGVTYLAKQFATDLAAQQNINLSLLLVFPYWLIFGVLGFTTLIGLAAGLYPAFRAARLDPIEALRYER